MAGYVNLDMNTILLLRSITGARAAGYLTYLNPRWSFHRHPADRYEINSQLSLSARSGHAAPGSGSP